MKDDPIEARRVLSEQLEGRTIARVFLATEDLALLFEDGTWFHVAYGPGFDGGRMLDDGAPINPYALHRLGIVDEAEYRRRIEEECRRDAEERDRREYERLKAKYEPEA